MTEVDGEEPSASTRLIPFFPALDGLRGYFLIAVVLFHARWGFDGALLTMSGFFTLSGFLIAWLLISEWQTSGRIDLKRFLLRRVRRLMPAAMTAIVLSAVLWNIFELRNPGFVDPGEVDAHTNDSILAATFYVFNWHQIAGPIWTGFRSLGFPTAPEGAPLAHFWSLAVEEQFYLIFPALAFGCLAFLRGIRGLAVAAALGIGAVLVFQPTIAGLEGYERLRIMDRIYVGTDIRMAEVLIGVLLAVVFAHPAARERVQQSVLVGVGGAAAFVLMTYWIFTMDIASEWLYNRGFFVVGLIFALIIAALTQRGGPLVALMNIGVLRWLGQRSYGMYVYHFPIMRLADEEQVDIGRWPLLVLRVGLTLVAGALSYTYLEEPIRRGRRPEKPIGWALAGTAALVVPVAVVLA